MSKNTIKELEGIGFITEFLSIVHPNLDPNNVKDNKAGVEIRPIPRDERYNTKLSKSHVFWQLDTRGKEYLIKFVNNIRNSDSHFDLTYSVWTFDRDKDTKTESGKKAAKNTITKANALYTQEIAIDLDDLTEPEKNKMVIELKNIGLSGLWVYSGHGYHLHILLKDKLYDAEVVKMIAYLLRAKGFFKVDTRCTDKARVFRLPGTANNKCFEPGGDVDERANPPMCEVVDWCWDRYSIEDIIEALNKLETVDNDFYASYLNTVNEHQKVISSIAKFDDDKNHKTVNYTEEDIMDLVDGTVEEENMELKPYIIKEEKIEPIKAEELPEDCIVLKSLDYPYIQLQGIPFEPVKKILTRTEEGYRNTALGFLVWLFKVKYGFNKGQILEIIEVWAKNACKPTYPNYKADFERFYRTNGLSYTTELAKHFGYINFNDSSIFKVKSDDQIIIPNSILEDFTKFKKNGFLAYLGIKFAEKYTETPTQKDIEAYLNITDKTARTALNDARQAGVIYRKRGPDKNYIYNSHKIIKPTEGFKRFDTAKIKLYLTELNKTEIQIMMHLHYCSGDWGCIKSQENLGEVCGISQQMVSKAIKNLEKKGYIKVERTKLSEQCIIKCTYVLVL